MTTQPADAQLDIRRDRLLTRLRAIRATAAAAALAAGASQALLTILAAAILLIALDYLLRLPGPLRLALGLAFLLTTGYVLYRLVLARLRLPGLPEVARQVQPSLDAPPDSLASSADFLLTGTRGPFVDRTVALAAGLVDQLSPARFLRWRWLLAWLTALLLTLALLAASWPAVGWWIECGLQRLAWPAARADWPRRIRIASDFAGRSLLVPPAEPVTLTAQLARGSAATPMTLVLAEGDHLRRFDMTDLGQGRRTVTVRPAASSTFWFEAGDDTTRDNPGTLRVVPRPQVLRAEILVQPASYTGQAPSRITLGSSPVRVPEGSRIDLAVIVTKDLADLNSQPHATITLVPADAPDAQPVEDLPVRFGRDRRTLVAGWWCRRDSLVRVEFTDTDGLASAAVHPWRILVQPDQLPTIEVLSPPDNVEVAPRAVMALQATAADDWGIDTVNHAWRIVRATADTSESSSLASHPLPLSPRPSPLVPRHSSLVPAVPPLAPSPGTSVDEAWPLEPLALAPGDRVIWHLAVQDNYNLEGRRHDPVRSPERTIRIISETDVLKSVLDDLAAAHQRIARLHADQKALRDTLASPATVAQPSETLRSHADQQGRVAQQTGDLATSMAAAANRLQANRVDRPDLAAAADEASQALSAVQSREMADAQRRLRDAQARSTTDPARRSDVQSAEQSADAARRALEDLLARTGAWTTAEAAALGLEEMIDRQQAIRRQTSQIAEDTVGKPLDALSGQQRQDLDALAGQQRALADRLNRLQSDMARQAQPSPRSSDAPSPANEQARRLQQAAEQLQQHNAVGSMANSAADLSRNVTSSAQQRQQQAQQAMEQALSTLRGRQSPSPQSPSSDQSPESAAALAQRLRELAQRQEQLRDQTHQIDRRRDHTGQLDRPSRLRLSLAGREQQDLSQQVDQAREQAPGDQMQQALGSVAEQMDQVAQQIDSGASGQPVQQSQQQAAERLLAMAAAAEQQARGQGDPSQADPSQGDPSQGRPGTAQASANQPRVGNQPRSGNTDSGQQSGQLGPNQGQRSSQGGTQAAQDSFLPPEQTPTPTAALPDRLGAVEAWGFLPPDQRRQVLQGMQAEPPPRYRRITERYWRVLNESVTHPAPRSPAP